MVFILYNYNRDSNCIDTIIYDDFKKKIFSRNNSDGQTDGRTV